MNFALLLVILTIISGIVCLMARYYFDKREVSSVLILKTIEYSRSFFPVFLIVLLIRSFLIEPFRIPSGSLEPTLLVGDFLAVNKFIYGLHLPVLETRILPVKNPKTGEIAIFRWPPDPSYDYIKRVIGTPNDKVAYKNKILYVNGQEVKQTFKGYTVDESSGKAVIQYEEVLNGVSHAIFVRPDVPAYDFEITVPAGHYFMMGDNRDDSADSRFWGFVPESFLRGEALLVWMSWNGKKDTVRFSRIGKIIR